jgi:hypothetical protein
VSGAASCAFALLIFVLIIYRKNRHPLSKVANRFGRRIKEHIMSGLTKTDVERKTDY